MKVNKYAYRFIFASQRVAFLALTVTVISMPVGILGCSDVKLDVSRELSRESPLAKAIREKKELSTIRDIISQNPGIIQKDERAYTIGPLAQALLYQNEDLVDFLIDSGANTEIAINSLSNSYPHSCHRYIGLLHRGEEEPHRVKGLGVIQKVPIHREGGHLHNQKSGD